MSRPAPEQCCGGGNDDQSFRNGGQLFIVSDEPPALHDPGEGALNDPWPLNDNKALSPWHAVYDFQRQIGLVLGPGDQRSAIPAIRKDSLNELVQAARTPQQAIGTVAVLHISPMHLDPQQPSVGVGQDVALTAADFLARVEAFESHF